MSSLTPFSKWEGLGNDFILVSGSPPEQASQMAQQWCQRRKGIGADGLVFIDEALRMVIFNSDGSRGAVCGNALRCVAAWWHQQGKLAPGETLEVITDSGPRPLLLVSPHWVEVNMQEPQEVQGCANVLPLPEIGLPGHFVSLGNPHLVVLCPEGLPSEANFLRWGQAWQTASFSPPGGVNVEFVARERERLKVLVWERGVGPTPACGSGACAALVTAVRVGWVDGPTWLELPGGALQVAWQGQGPVWMSGPARHVFEGSFALENFPTLNPQEVIPCTP